jgi:hypothetical protein
MSLQSAPLKNDLGIDEAQRMIRTSRHCEL